MYTFLQKRNENKEYLHFCSEKANQKDFFAWWCLKSLTQAMAVSYVTALTATVIHSKANWHSEEKGKEMFNQVYD